jgi:7-cyano-7-deazaguanine synthase
VSLLPTDKAGAVVILSGGLDSTIAMRLAVETYGAANVRALTFFYGQKQKVEIERAMESTTILKVKHKVIDARFLGDISKGFSANVDSSIAMPTIDDILGDPRPVTYVPNRNMILLSIAAAYAEVEKIDLIICGLQQNDMYNYHDTTPRFVDKINDVLSENRIQQIRVVSPFADMNKTEELKILHALDGNVDLLWHTLTCYNPDERGRSCGQCPSCAERMQAFDNLGLEDPVEYIDEKAQV